MPPWAAPPPGAAGDDPERSWENADTDRVAPTAPVGGVRRATGRDGSPDAGALPPRRLHPAWILLSLIRSARGFVIPVAVLLFSGSRGDTPFLAVGGGIAALSIAAQTATWWLFRYEVADGKLRVRSGLFNRQERSVPLDRIQAVDVAETPLQRLLGIVRIRIETAAGGTAGSDVTLEALSRADAADLRARLGAARQRTAALRQPATTPGDPPRPAGRPATLAFGESGELIRALSPGALLAAGATSGRIGPALAIFGFVSQLADDVLPERLWERLAMLAPGFSFRGVLIAAAVIGVGAWLLAIGSTVLAFGGFALRREGDQLQISAGLLDRRRSTIPLGRIQAITITEGLLRQPFGLAALRIESAGYGTDSAESGVLFPLIRRSEIAGLLERACPEVAVALTGPAAVRLAGPPPRARRRYVLGGVWSVLLATVGTTLAAWAIPPAPWWWGLAPLALVPPVALLGLLGYRDAGWAVDAGGRLVVRGRGLARQTAVMPLRRIQRREIGRDLLQRRARLATFRAAVASGGAGGRVEVAHLDDEEADALLTRLATPQRPARSARRPVAAPGEPPGGLPPR